MNPEFSLFHDQRAAARLSEYVREEEAVYLTLNFGLEIVSRTALTGSLTRQEVR